MTDQTKTVEVKTEGNVTLGTSTPNTKLHLKTDEEKAKDFVKDYEALCEKHQLQIVTTPAWKVSQDTGDWRLVLQNSVGKIPKATI